MIDQFLLALFSLGFSSAAVGLALYIIKVQGSLSGSKGLPQTVEKPPSGPLLPLPARQDSIGLEVKKRLERARR